LFVLSSRNADLIALSVTIALLVAAVAALLYGLTFSATGRVQMARFLNAKGFTIPYKKIRSNAGTFAIVGLLLVVVGMVFLPRERLTDSESAPASATLTKREASSAATSPVASHEAELEEARKFMCAFGEYAASRGEPQTPENRSILAGAADAHIQGFFHVSHEEASEVASQVEKEASTPEFNCLEILKRNPLKMAWPEYRARGPAENVRAATIFCREFRPMLKPGETVRDSENLLLSSPCNIADGEVEYCPNGTRLGPSNTIADQFKIPWQQANADIVAGLEGFEQKSPIDDACAELARQDPSESGALEKQQTLDARLALCVAADDEYQDVLQGKSHKDAVILANQYSVGERAGGRAIGREWGAYEDGEWRDSECSELSVAPWAHDEGYFGDPIHLPDGAIKLVVNSAGWVPRESDIPRNPEGTIGKSDTK
jgi:hypothetical protein